MTSLTTKIKSIIPNQYLPAAISSYYTIRSLAYLGNNFICPCCGGHFRRFLPYNKNQPDANNVCPRCGSFERHRLLWLYLKNKTNIFEKNLKILHCSPEYFLQKQLISNQNLQYIGADLDSPLANVKMDLTKIQYDDNYFDVILCNHVLEHIPNDIQAMKELFRVLKPGGWAILQVPIDPTLEKTFEDPNIISPQDRERLFGQSDHVRMYGRDYKNRLEDAGFTVKVDKYIDELSDNLIQKYGLLSNEYIYFGSKH
ncbi:methyltransferase domain-containing protein [Laspinema sp. A4]|uniref:class I SAM-dependent methyltransferase n=1 Tax=Laspinema sp. D2d TaxID=2953686 RepID=UPI0021BAB73B|nr:class I SAM-dependent methyltransferase [Laspinema sp. D2d]MCT7983620.1 methyltransferase domain-containing protein [Laspinema sp. D2d]